MFSLYSDLPAPKNTSSSSPAPPTDGAGGGAASPAGWASNSKFLTTASPLAAKQSPAAAPPAASPQASAAGQVPPPSKDSAAVGGVALSSLLAQTVMLKRKRQQQPAPKTTSARVSAGTVTTAPAVPERDPPIVIPTPVGGGRGTGSGATSLIGIGGGEEEYDPLKPNDYEEILRQRQQRLARAQREREYEERHERRSDRDAVDEEHKRPRSHRPPSDFAPPSYDEANAQIPMHTDPAAKAQIDLHISGEEAYRRRAMLSAQPQVSVSEWPQTPASPVAEDMDWISRKDDTEENPAPSGAGSSLGEKLLKKMGWTEGQGLGANGQGMRAPLEHKKVGKGSSGIIVHQTPRQPARPQRSRVVLLRNMVGPGEVDDDLQSETASECEKFGSVLNCAIYEEVGPYVPPEKAVRIFVQFSGAEAATKAVDNLNGRFFAKRKVEATYFDEERFKAGELAVRAGED